MGFAVTDGVSRSSVVLKSLSILALIYIEAARDSGVQPTHYSWTDSARRVVWFGRHRPAHGRTLPAPMSSRYRA